MEREESRNPHEVMGRQKEKKTWRGNGEISGRERREKGIGSPDTDMERGIIGPIDQK